MGAEVMPDKKRMGGMKLGQFGGVKPHTPAEPTPEPIPEAPKAEPKPKARRKQKEALSTLNIKVPRSQQRWLLDKAQQVRDNNAEPVPPDQRVYPQHLIGVAISLLQAQNIDWDTVRNADELRDRLNL